jgi:Ca2+-binding EF-hand superfamily protein
MRIPCCSLPAVSALCLLLLDGAALGQTGASPTPRDWVKQYDQNRDGKINREEFHQAVVEAFFFRDKTRSGYLTVTELHGASPEAVKAASRRGDERLSLPEYVNALFKDFEVADADTDGMLTAEEIDIYIRSNRR